MSRVGQAAWGVVVLCAVGASAQQGPDHGDGPVRVDTLLAAFAKMPGLEARFIEEKHMSLLAVPLVSRGRLYFTAPGYLLRRIETPQPSQVLITPRTLVLRDADQSETIDLRSRRDVRFLVSSFVSLLAGDEAALREAYLVELAEHASGGWKMELVPKSSPLTDLIAKIQVLGHGLVVQEIRVIERTGDQTVTTLVEVDPKRQFTASERKALFGITAS